LSAAAVLAGPGLLPAHEGHQHKAMGTVIVLDAQHVELDLVGGKKESYAINKNTKYIKGRTSVTAADVRIGERVVISVVEKDGKKSATQILMADKPQPHEH
jgi:hypothetical protein